MDYKEVSFSILSAEDFHKDLIMDGLAEIGYDSFEDSETGFNAFIPDSNFDQSRLDILLESFRDLASFSYSVKTIPHQNWNEIWEGNFEPLQINDACYIRATFHEPRPQYPYEIIIDPKMAFGTGHHQTTAAMLELMMKEDFRGRNVLDMGCGTGILAIMASKLGASEIIAIDYDPVCYESTLENAALNGVPNITALCGSKEEIPNQKFDFILANINRNILLDQLERYSQVMKESGALFLSGFYLEPDLALIKERAELLHFKYSSHKTSDDWVAAKFLYQPSNT